jgi:hypothetical protein
MAIFIGLWPSLLTTKFNDLQKIIVVMLRAATANSQYSTPIFSDRLFLIRLH